MDKSEIKIERTKRGREGKLKEGESIALGGNIC